MQPSLYIIAGPNGAGKTTFASEFLPKHENCKRFINADLIAKGLSPFSPQVAGLKAGRIVIKEIRDAISKKEGFAFETTLSGKTNITLIKQMKAAGYAIHLVFLWIPDIELSLARIRERVARGGHDVPEKDVRRRLDRGLKNLFHTYRPLLDTWALFDNSSAQPRLIARELNGILEVIDQVLYEKIVTIAK